MNLPAGMSPIQDVVNTELMEIEASLPLFEDDPFPENVYHYTTATGLLGIMESSTRRRRGGS